MAGQYQVIITEPAEQDLKDILEYIQENTGDQAALNMQQAILKAINDLAQMPTKNSLVRELIGLSEKNYRRAIVKKRYRVIYQIEEADKDVFVIRILHIKRGPDFVRKSVE